MADFDPAWAAGGTRRAPTTAEQSTGFACGPADPNLFNFLFHRMQSEFAAVIAAGEDAPSDAALDQTLQAIYYIVRTRAPTIFASVTINVATSGVASPADPFAGDAFDKLSSAFTWLRGWRVMPGIVVTVAVAGATFAETGNLIDLSHPDGLSIQIVGAALSGVFPVNADFVGTKATDTAMLRARFATKIDCAANGVLVGRAGLRLIKNILFSGTGSATGLLVGKTANFVEVSFEGAGPAATAAVNCWFNDFGDGMLARSGSHLSVMNVGSSYNGAIGILVNDGSYLQGYNVLSVHNTAQGIYVRDRSVAEISTHAYINKNGSEGIRALRSHVYLCLLYTSPSPRD